MSSAATNTGRGTWSVVAGRWAMLLVLLFLWQGAHRWLGPYTIASPLDTFERLWDMAQDGTVWQHLVSTARVSAIGLVAGWCAGLLVALAMARSARLAAALEPYIMASMGVPKFALAPLLILWFGIGDAPKAVVVTLMVFYVVFITAISGLRAVDGRLLQMSRLMGASSWQATREVLLPSITPYLLAGLKVAIPRAISAAVVGEFLVAESGLGYYIEHSRQTSDTVGVYAGLVVVTALVLSSDGLLGMLSRRLLAWRPAVATAGH
ncbi:ABC transporter permease [Hydrogenophaga sp. BPS33]|uniref:ABC transporter permease n=1 Tax=Hydrogenophaga sp. BPS33 TaxID=2651974 RepID=UPI0013203DBC|nr:ABC transporter permease [Hydrogenophaga sp. BPS33]QHE87335.1 ABC transporter permease [Hydrogenophaga sp. BPS33]